MVMVIQTSNYASTGKIRKEMPEAVLIAISKKVPDSLVEYIDVHEPRLSPNEDFFMEYKNSNDLFDRETSFIRHFMIEIIDKNLDDVMHEWNKKYASDVLVLICYEGSTDFCHRQIVAEAIETRYNLTLNEYGYENCERSNGRIKVKSSLDDEW